MLNTDIIILLFKSDNIYNLELRQKPMMIM